MFKNCTKHEGWYHLNAIIGVNDCDTMNSRMNVEIIVFSQESG